jgi:hypothetical protein
VRVIDQRTLPRNWENAQVGTSLKLRGIKGEIGLSSGQSDNAWLRCHTKLCVANCSFAKRATIETFQLSILMLSAKLRSQDTGPDSVLLKFSSSN